MLHERSQTQKAACCMIPLRLHFGKGKLTVPKKQKKNFFCQGLGERADYKRVHEDIWGGYRTVCYLDCGDGYKT